MLRFCLRLCLAFAPVFAAPLGAAPPLVFAAASLTDSLREAGAVYAKQSGQRVDFDFGASNMLARQIAAGAPADLFISADESTMDMLANRGLIDGSSRRSLLSNTLVVVALGESPLAVSSAAGLTGPAIAHLALADPRAVPAGVYARSYLSARGLWKVLEGRVLPTENVRGALLAVESGEADVAMVYRTDALMSRKVRILFEVPPGEGPRIAYPFAVVGGSAHAEAARLFLNFLASDAGLSIFRSFGFGTLPQGR